MTDYKCLFLDVDGTILTPDNTIQSSTRDAIAQVQNKGVEVFLSTGRPLHEIDELAKELNIQSFVGYNGAYAKYKGKDLYQESMDPEIIEQFLKIAKEHNHKAVLFTDSANFFTEMDSPTVKEFIEVFHLTKNEVYSRQKERNILGMTLMNLKETDPELYQPTPGFHLSQVNIANMLHCYDVIMDKINKGYGIQMVLKHLGLSKEVAIAFGDGMNDKEMLHSVGEGFAMGNGHPDLFQYAKHRTTAVTDSGIFNGLKSLGLVE
ncbi:HAD family hydrolase [Neobacillus sp. LXY-1]|uniref:HAD family hydrolase n=1 Tax=Neobacillus sp. LXY-1 TaxID=3379133 RepID=UPI003EE0C5FA